MDKVNLDELLNYKEEYSKFVQKPEYKKERMTSLCPFHDDRKPSLSVDLKTGKFVCFACGKAGKRWLHHPRAETYLSERVALFQRLYR